MLRLLPAWIELLTRSPEYIEYGEGFSKTGPVVTFLSNDPGAPGCELDVGCPSLSPGAANSAGP